MQYFLHTWVYGLRAISVINSIPSPTLKRHGNFLRWREEIKLCLDVWEGSRESEFWEVSNQRGKRSEQNTDGMVHAAGLRQKIGKGHGPSLYVLELFRCNCEATTCDKVSNRACHCLSTEPWIRGLSFPLYSQHSLCVLCCRHFFCQESVQMM